MLFNSPDWVPFFYTPSFGHMTAFHASCIHNWVNSWTFALQTWRWWLHVPPRCQSVSTCKTTWCHSPEDHNFSPHFILVRTETWKVKIPFLICVLNVQGTFVSFFRLAYQKKLPCWTVDNTANTIMLCSYHCILWWLMHSAKASRVKCWHFFSIFTLSL
jgi:hypothetical protein